MDALNIDAFHMDDDNCPICTDLMEANTKYSIDCGHTYHTSCIVSWFREGNGSCPMCRAPSIHMNDGSNNGYFSWEYTLNPFLKSAFTKYCKKPKANAQVVRVFKKYNEMQVDYKTKVKEYQDFRKVNKEVLKTWSRVRNARWKTQRKLRRLVRMLKSVPIVPFIVKVAVPTDAAENEDKETDPEASDSCDSENDTDTMTDISGIEESDNENSQSDDEN